MKLDKAEVRTLAVRAEVDPRSIERTLRGEIVRGMSGRRARREVARYLRQIGAPPIVFADPHASALRPTLSPAAA